MFTKPTSVTAAIPEGDCRWELALALARIEVLEERLAKYVLQEAEIDRRGIRRISRSAP
jgi:hypothetical protein